MIGRSVDRATRLSCPPAVVPAAPGAQLDHCNARFMNIQPSPTTSERYFLLCLKSTSTWIQKTNQKSSICKFPSRSAHYGQIKGVSQEAKIAQATEKIKGADSNFSIISVHHHVDQYRSWSQHTTFKKVSKLNFHGTWMVYKIFCASVCDLYQPFATMST